jgi:hypothetical protein
MSVRLPSVIYFTNEEIREIQDDTPFWVFLQTEFIELLGRKLGLGALIECVCNPDAIRYECDEKHEYWVRLHAHPRALLDDKCRRSGWMMIRGYDFEVIKVKATKLPLRA